MDGDMNKVVCPDCDTLYRPGDRHACAKQVNPPNPKQRYGDAKVPLGLIPSAAKVYTGLALAEGARKYGPYNWRDKAVEAMTYVHAAERHIASWVDGEDMDPDSGFPHLGHALACLSILADAIEIGNLIDNRPLPAPTGELLRDWMQAAEVEKPPCALDGRNCPPDHDHGPLTAPRDWWSDGRSIPPDGPMTATEVIERTLPNEYPFTEHRTMAVVMADEHRATADQRQNAAFGEGDETEADKHTHRWIALKDEKVMACVCGAEVPIVEQKPTPHIHHWMSMNTVTHPGLMVCVDCGEQYLVTDQKPGQYTIKLPEIDLIDEKYPCYCRDMDRCLVDNGHPIGNNVFCCKGEAGV